MQPNTDSLEDGVVSQKKNSSFTFLSAWLSSFGVDREKELAEQKMKMQEREQTLAALKAQSAAMSKVETTLRNTVQGLDTYLEEAQVTQKTLSGCLSETEVKTALSTKSTQNNSPPSAAAMHLSLAQLNETEELLATNSKLKPQEIERGALEIEEHANQAESVTVSYLTEAHESLRRQTALAAAKKAPAKTILVAPSWTSLYSEASGGDPSMEEKTKKIGTKSIVAAKFL